MSTKEVVVVGGNYGAIRAVKAILESVQPKSSTTYHVTVISPSSDAFFNIAAPRVLVEPSQAKGVVVPLARIFAKYSKSQLTVVKATVNHIDFAAQSVTYDGSSIKYDYVIIASGARSLAAGFKLETTADDAVNHLRALANQAKAAETIVIGGGGATGVESAGELGLTYPSKTVLLYTGASQPLPSQPKLSSSAAKKLADLGVKVINNVKIVSADTKGDKTVLQLSDGSQKIVDLYISSVGVEPNTSFLESSVLDKEGYVVVDENLRLKGVSNAYAIGDVVSGYSNTVVDIEYGQRQALTASLLHDLVGSSNALAPHKPVAPFAQLVPISKNGGVGIMKGFSMPNFFVKMLKSKTFMIPKAESSLSG